MTEEYLTIDDLLKLLKRDPDAGKALVAEIVAQFTKEYLTIEEAGAAAFLGGTNGQEQNGGRHISKRRSLLCPERNPAAV